jgi:hypothetical protein
MMRMDVVQLHVLQVVLQVLQVVLAEARGGSWRLVLQVLQVEARGARPTMMMLLADPMEVLAQS